MAGWGPEPPPPPPPEPPPRPRSGGGDVFFWPDWNLRKPVAPACEPCEPFSLEVGDGEIVTVRPEELVGPEVQGSDTRAECEQLLRYLAANIRRDENGRLVVRPDEPGGEWVPLTAWLAATRATRPARPRRGAAPAGPGWLARGPQAPAKAELPCAIPDPPPIEPSEETTSETRDDAPVAVASYAADTTPTPTQVSYVLVYPPEPPPSPLPYILVGAALVGVIWYAAHVEQQAARRRAEEAERAAKKARRRKPARRPARRAATPRRARRG